MSSLQQEAIERVAASRWQFWQQTFRALTSSAQQTIQLGIQGAVHRRTAEVRSEAQGHSLVPACPGCGSIERKDFRKNGSYRRQLVTTQGVVQIDVPRLRCRCGKSIPVEHDAFRPRQRFAFDFHLALLELVGMRASYRKIAQHFARRGVPVSAASLSRQFSRIDLPALGPLSGSPREISVDGMYVHLWDRERGWKGESACVLLAVNHDPAVPEKILGMVFAPSESEEAYRSLADLLISRGMDANGPLTVVSDGAKTIPAAFAHSFPLARFQRCQIHLVWEVREEAPLELKRKVEGSAWWVLRGKTMEQARERLEAFVARYNATAPKSVAALERGFEAATLCLREKVLQRTNGRAERYVRECRRFYRPREAFRDNAAAVRAIALWAPIINAPHTGTDWLANLFAAQLGFSRRLTQFPSPIHT